MVKFDEMDYQAVNIVENYVVDHLPSVDRCTLQFNTFIVWKCKTLLNWKYLISTDLLDGMYYELTYNGHKDEWYLDAYKKVDNQRIKV